MLRRTTRIQTVLLMLPGIWLVSRPAFPQAILTPDDRIAADEAIVERDVSALQSRDAAVREAAAAQLRSIVCRYPSGTTDLRRADAGRADWEARFAQIHSGMRLVDALSNLGNPTEMTRATSGVSRSISYRLDDHWITDIYLGEGDTVLKAEGPRRSERIVFALQTRKFSGTEIEYFVNGNKAREASYFEGHPNGVFITYHDNGTPAAEFYHDRQADTEDAIWFADGRPKHTWWVPPRIADGEEIKRYPSGRMRTITELRSGQPHGLMAGWYENGQQRFVSHYRYGIQRGVEAVWAPDGSLVYRHMQ